ncbi:MAG TPA: phosphatase PAP2 family protein [Acidimicrobiia bacterium]|nr:phosphatase PAP2 family protein [Acidimicrobiia bacterium]
MTTVLTRTDEAATPASGSPLHRTPPFTPQGLYGHRREILIGLGSLFAFLAIAAKTAHGTLLLTWDEPIQHWVEGSRTAAWTSFFMTASALGSTKAVLALGVTSAALVWQRCRAAALTIVVAMLARPLVEFTLKALVARDRPDFERLVPGNGPSFPSGHPMAAIACWGLLPIIVALFTNKRTIWWASVAVSVAAIALIGASRVYLGVHWFSDVVGGLVAGAFFLLFVEFVLEREHERRGGCCGDERAVDVSRT